MSKKVKEQGSDEQQTGTAPVKAQGCGVTHQDCSSTFKGTCDRSVGHTDSHHCSSCNSMF